MTKNICIILLCILAIIPSYYVEKHLYSHLVVCIGCLLCIIIILLSSVRISVKITCIMIIIYFYGRNVRLIFSTISMILFPDEKIPLYIRVKKMYENNGLKIVEDFSKLPSKPTIFVANYCQDRIENAMCTLLPRKIAILMRETCHKYNINNIVKRTIVVHGHHNGNFAEIEKAILKAHKDGCDIFVYASSMSHQGYIGKLRTGIFAIAKKNNITMTPVAIDRIDSRYGIIYNQNLQIRVGNTFNVNNVHSAQYSVRKFFLQSLEKFADEKYVNLKGMN